MFFDVAAKAVHCARTGQRLPDENKWNTEALQALSATPWSVHEPKDPEVVFKDKDDVDQALVRPEAARYARRTYTRQGDIEAFGYTVGCPRCDHERRYGPGRTGKPHSESCRDKFMKELEKTEVGRQRLAKTEQDRSQHCTGEREARFGTANLEGGERCDWTGFSVACCRNAGAAHV